MRRANAVRAVRNAGTSIVIADEAHRSQYDFIDGLARHMRDALPNASFIGFTGTPIETADANTRAVFGDYIDIYHIQPGGRGRRHGADLLREPAVAAGVEPTRAAADRPRVRGDHRRRGVDEQGEAKTKWAALEKIVGSRKRIAQIAADWSTHSSPPGGDGRARR